MTSFIPADINKIRKIIGKSASKSCTSNPVPTWLLIEEHLDHVDVLVPVITDISKLFSRSNMVVVSRISAQLK